MIAEYISAALLWLLFSSHFNSKLRINTISQQATGFFDFIEHIFWLLFPEHQVQKTRVISVCYPASSRTVTRKAVYQQLPK